MKKKLALLLSAIMVLGSLPMTAFASTQNTISRIVTGTEDTVYSIGNKNSSWDAPVLTFSEREVGKFSKSTTSVTFKATLENAEWSIDDSNGNRDHEITKTDYVYDTTGATPVGPENGYGKTANASSSVMILSSKQAIFTLPVETLRGEDSQDKAVYLPLEVELTDVGDGRITIDAMESNLTSGTYKFANIVDGDVAVSIADTVKLVENGKTIETIVITENTAGALRDATGNARLRIRLTSGFEFENKVPVIATYPTNQLLPDTEDTGLNNADGSVIKYLYSEDGQDLYLYFKVPETKDGKGTSSPVTISISGLSVKFDEDDVAIGRVCEATISGAGISKATVEVGTATTYGITWEAENKTLPVLYSGRADENEETLEATFKETIGDSWLAARKTTITFPEGVKVMDVNIGKHTNVENLELETEDNVVTLKNGILTAEGDTNKHKKATMEMTFTLSIGPRFEGDVVATLGGAGVEGELEATVATVVSPVTVEAQENEVSIDYRKVSISDITITEAFAGALEKGKKLRLSLDHIGFDDTPVVEVTKGDIVIEKVTDDSNTITLEVKYASTKEASTIKLSGNSLYLQRDIPAGKYDLKLSAIAPVEKTEADDFDLTGWGTQVDVNTWDPDYNDDCIDAYFQTSVKSGAKYKGTIYFDQRSKTVVPGFIDVVTAGRDQDDSTFTTQLVVQVGASTMTAGKQTINLDVPAYIKDGYTMLPVRAITEALSSVAVVNWDDPSHTVTIQFGSRIIKMTVGSENMVINGVEVAMSAKCEITDSRAFVPLRDLGYALGLNDSKINWDDATKTATLN